MQKSQKENWVLMLTSAFYVLIKNYNQLRSPQKNVLFGIYKTSFIFLKDFLNDL